jgi:hypothetical protein
MEVNTGPCFVSVYSPKRGRLVSLVFSTDAMTDFVDRFDKGEFQDLIEED